MKKELLEELVLTELNGKNAAIHAYDRIIWTVRSGYLTLVFVGWSFIIKSFGEALSEDIAKSELIIGMLLITLGLTVGGWLTDRNYVRRKFRVILKTNELMKAILKSNASPASIPLDLLKVSGDDGNAPFKCRGYLQASWCGTIIFLCPIVSLTIVALMLLY